MTAKDLQDRTKRFALEVMGISGTIPPGIQGQTINRQLLRAATSVAANYRAACRARSRAEFASKLGIEEEEADETEFWMELLVEGGLVRRENLVRLMEEAVELRRIMAASRKSAREETGKGE